MVWWVWIDCLWQSQKESRSIWNFAVVKIKQSISITINSQHVFTADVYFISLVRKFRSKREYAMIVVSRHQSGNILRQSLNIYSTANIVRQIITATTTTMILMMTYCKTHLILLCLWAFKSINQEFHTCVTTILPPYLASGRSTAHRWTSTIYYPVLVNPVIVTSTIKACFCFPAFS